MKVLALLLLLLSPLLVSSASHTFLPRKAESGRRYNANVLQSTVVQIRGGGLGGGKAKAPSKSTNKKSTPSAPVAKKKFTIDFREKKTQIGLLASVMFCIPILTA
jgi:hypothetical protein